MNKNLIAIILFLSIFSVMPISVSAHCPVCSAAIGVLAVTAKYYGLDVSLIGLFVGAFAISTGFWVGNRIKRNYFRLQFPLIVLFSFILTVFPLLSISGDLMPIELYLIGPIGSLLNNIYFIDKFLWGSIIGSLVTLSSFKLHELIKERRGRVFFPYQGIVLTLSVLIVAGVLLSVIMGV